MELNENKSKTESGRTKKSIQEQMPEEHSIANASSSGRHLQLAERVDSAESRQETAEIALDDRSARMQQCLSVDRVRVQ